MEIGAQKDMFLRSTPMPLAGAARAFPGVPGRGDAVPPDYMHMPPSMRMTSPVM